MCPGGPKPLLFVGPPHSMLGIVRCLGWSFSGPFWDPETAPKMGFQNGPKKGPNKKEKGERRKREEREKRERESARERKRKRERREEKKKEAIITRI